MRSVKKSTSHTLGETMIYLKASDVIKKEEYEATWKTFKDKEEAEAQEWVALKLYAENYHELPPFNLKASRGRFRTPAPIPDDFIKHIISP